MFARRFFVVLLSVVTVGELVVVAPLLLFAVEEGKKCAPAVGFVREQVTEVPCVIPGFTARTTTTTRAFSGGKCISAALIDVAPTNCFEFMLMPRITLSVKTEIVEDATGEVDDTLTTVLPDTLLGAHRDCKDW
jgi:hypothetical protein